MRITREEILEKSCKEIIETILTCLDSAIKGTIYLIGPVPELRAVRVTSGLKVDGSDTIKWGLPEKSDYNYPGKTWLQYRDEPGRPLEAMAWCVERQRSWTADNPAEDTRSVRKQLLGQPENCHHMEPVLIKKSEIYGDRTDLDYPKTWDGTPIWQNTDYVVVAVIKIHFLPNSIKRGDKSTRLIKKLSRLLGSELLTMYLKEIYCEAQRDLERKRLESCNELAHQLRNPIMKLAFISSAINAEISFLREQWEKYISQSLPDLPTKDKIIERLNQVLSAKLDLIDGDMQIRQLVNHLLAKQNDIKTLYLHPKKNSEKISNQLLPLWNSLLSSGLFEDQEQSEVINLLRLLEEAVWYGLNDKIKARINHIPDEVKNKWCELAYCEFTPDNQQILEDILDFLETSPVAIPHSHHIKKVLTYLKHVTEIIKELEERVNAIVDNLKTSIVDAPGVCKHPLNGTGQQYKI